MPLLLRPGAPSRRRLTRRRVPSTVRNRQWAATSRAFGARTFGETFFLFFFCALTRLETILSTPLAFSLRARSEKKLAARLFLFHSNFLSVLLPGNIGSSLFLLPPPSRAIIPALRSSLALVLGLTPRKCVVKTFTSAAGRPRRPRRVRMGKSVRKE